MTMLIQWYPGDEAVWFAIRLLTATASLILFAAVGARLALRRRPAARHALWLAVLLAVTVSPLTIVVADWSGWNWSAQWAAAPDSSPQALARLHVETPFDDTPAVYPELRGTTELSQATANVIDAERDGPSPAEVRQGLATAAAATWLAGVMFCLLRLLRGIREARRILAQAEPLDWRQFPDATALASRAIGRQPLPPIMRSSAAAGPLVAGLFRPIVVLPADFATSIGSSRLAEVLIHECAHVLRGDLWIGLLQRLVQMALWPHPLVYLMNRSLSRAREEVCDNFVLRGVDSAAYAQTLLEIAQRCRGQRIPAPALAFFSNRWKLEDRVAGLLDPRRKIATQCGRGRLLVLTALLIFGGSAFAAARFDELPAANSPQAAVQDGPASRQVGVGLRAQRGRSAAIANAYIRNRESFRHFKCSFQIYEGSAPSAAAAIADGPAVKDAAAVGTWIVDGPNYVYERVLSPNSARETVHTGTQRCLGNGVYELTSSGDLGSAMSSPGKVRAGFTMTPWDMAASMGSNASLTPAFMLTRGVEQGCKVEIADGLAGDARGCLNVAIRMPESESRFEFILDPARGYLPVEMTLKHGPGGRMDRAIMTKARQCSGDRWFPERVVAFQPINEGNPEGPCYVRELRVTFLDAERRPDNSELAITLKKGMWFNDEWTSHPIKQDKRVHVADLAEMDDIDGLRAEALKRLRKAFSAE